MGKLDEILKKNQEQGAAQAAANTNAAINEGSTHKDGASSSGGVDKDKIPAEGQNVIVKDSVLTEGNKDNVVTRAVVNDAANNAPDPKLAPSDAHASNVQNAAGAAYVEGSQESTASDGTRMESAQQPKIMAPAEPSSAARTSNIVTGMEVGQPVAPPLASPLEAILEKEEMSDDVRANLEAKSKGVYESNGLRRFHRKNGTEVVPKDGKFYAETDADVAELEHHATAGRVTKVAHKAVSNSPQVPGNKSIQDFNKKPGNKEPGNKEPSKAELDKLASDIKPVR